MGEPFPPGFLWGAATAAYQIEGSPLADGAGESNWHRFAHTPGLVKGGDTGDVACDHYRRWKDDVALMRDIGLKAYRFSISWSRVMPEGVRLVNERGLDFYRRLVDALDAAGIVPMATLFHWDLPAALENRGGWLNRDSADWFADYAGVMFEALDGGVRLWATLNEPWVITDGGYYHGILAPGHRNAFETPIAAHNLLRAHGAAVSAYRGHGRGAIGIVVNLAPKHPATDSDADRAAARRGDAYMNRQFLDPIFRGRYPAELPEMYGEAWPAFPDSDLDAVRVPVDFVGVNYYTRNVVRHDAKARPDGAANRAPGGSPYGDGVGGLSRRAVRNAVHGPRPLRRGAALRDGERRGVRGHRARPAMESSRILCGSRTSAITSPRRDGRSRRASTCAATSCGPSSTTSSGRTGTRSASASCAWTSRPRSGR